MTIETIDSIEQVKAALKEKRVCMGKVHPEAYHAWKKDLTNAISKSGLVDFMRNPYAYRWAQLNGVKKDSPAIRTGKLVDCLVLTPELLEDQYVVEEVNRRTNAGKARVEEIAASGRELVSPDEMAAARTAANIAMKHIAELPGTKYTQVAVWARIETIGVMKLDAPLTVCGMFDLLSVDENDRCKIIDLKTTSEDVSNRDALTRNIVNYKYATQAAMYSDLLRLATGEPPVDFSLLYLGMQEPHQTRLVGFFEADIDKYRGEYLLALERYATAAATDNWGSSMLPDFRFSLPAWAERSLN